MEITHRDRNGNYWRFVINCTPQQGEQIRRTLAGVRNMGNRAALSISAIIDADANGPLYAEFENAVLQGLAARFPADQERRTPQPVQGGKPKRPVFTRFLPVLDTLRENLRNSFGHEYGPLFEFLHKFGKTETVKGPPPQVGRVGAKMSQMSLP